MAEDYKEVRNPITGQVTSTGTNPYKQQMRRYGNRAQGVRQAAAARKRLMELRKSAATPPPTYNNEVDAAVAGAADKVAADKQAAKFAELRKEGKTPGFNLGLSENEQAFNQSVRRSAQGVQNRIASIRSRLEDAGGPRQQKLRNRLENLQTRRNNFRAQLFAPTGTNAPKMPKPPARPGMKRSKPKGGNTGGVAP